MRRILGFFVRRFAVALLIVWLVSVLVWTVIALFPGDPTRFILFEQAPSAERRAEAHEILGLDQPLPEQYGKWAWAAVHGDFGTSWATASKSVPAEQKIHVGLLLILFAVSAGGPLIGRIVGTGPNDPHPFAVDEGLKPVGPWTRVPAATSGAEGKDTVLLVLGGDGQLGRDELQRLLYGGRVSIIVAVGAALLAMTIGVLLVGSRSRSGASFDALISRLTDLVVSLPVLLVMLFIGVSGATTSC